MPQRRRAVVPARRRVASALSTRNCIATRSRLRLGEADATIEAKAQQHAALTDLVTTLTEQRAQSVDELTRTAAARDRLEGSCARRPPRSSAPSTRTRRKLPRSPNACTTRSRAPGNHRRDHSGTRWLVAQLAEVEERLEHTVQHAAADRDASMRAAAEREAEVQARFAHDASVRDALEQQLDEVTATLEQARQERAADAVAAAGTPRAA